MTIIYEPAGRAREYAPLAANLYRGCGHRCRYCYVPRALHLTAEAWAAQCAAPEPRPGVLEALAREAPKCAGDPREVLLCFSCDPYQPIEADRRVTRQALELLLLHDVRATVLTKNPVLAMLRDEELLRRADARLGVTLVSTSGEFTEKWEPGATTPAARLAALTLAQAAGIRTWVSIEPVIEPLDAYAVIEACARARVGEVKIGKLNHVPIGPIGPSGPIVPSVDWRAFAHEAAALCRKLGLTYTLKEDLRKWL